MAEGEERYRCQICGKMFCGTYELNRHQRVHTKERPFQCDQCKQSFSQKGSLHRHKLYHKRIKNFICSKCPMKFIQKVNMDTHYRQVHLPVDDDGSLHSRFLCQKCPSAFKTNGRLKIHRARIHGEMVMLDQWMRTTIGAETSQAATDSQCRSSLENTVQSEIVKEVVQSRRSEHLCGKTKSRQHCCTVCKAAFKRPCDLEQHVKSHSGVRSYRCDICDKTFSTKASCNTHSKLHSQDVIRLSCDTCDDKFSKSGTLKRHVAYIHEELKYTFICPYCQKNFRWLHNCRTHIKRFHTQTVSDVDKLLEPIKEAC